MGLNLTTLMNLENSSECFAVDSEDNKRHEIQNDRVDTGDIGDTGDRRKYQIDNHNFNTEGVRSYEIKDDNSNHSDIIEERRRNENDICEAIHTETMQEVRICENNRSTEDDAEMNLKDDVEMDLKDDVEDKLELDWKDDVLFVDVGNFSLSTGIIRKSLAENLGGNWPRFTVATLAGEGVMEEEQPPYWGGREEEYQGAEGQSPDWVQQDYRQNVVEDKEQNDNVDFLSKIGCDVMFKFQLGNDSRIENRLFSKVVFTFPSSSNSTSTQQLGQAEARTEDLLWGSRGLLAPGGELVMLGTHTAMPGHCLVMFSYKNVGESQQEEEDGRGI